MQFVVLYVNILQPSTVVILLGAETLKQKVAHA